MFKQDQGRKMSLKNYQLHLFSLTYWFKKYVFICFRERKGHGERDRNISQMPSASLHLLKISTQSRQVSWQGIEPVNSWYMEQHLILSHTSLAIYWFLFPVLKCMPSLMVKLLLKFFNYKYKSNYNSYILSTGYTLGLYYLVYDLSSQKNCKANTINLILYFF